ncbi:hypothetical protein HGM15179_001008 [Zosterops borbonicus]|uniref:Uncharacterized protein n=1 Tax=Zosterops borbonicus TaxID=364589 RepID=A0A8K1GXF1_9PASS|nr:hypothetical protein HGM15179_001008 [Zosterops borbonicus]
MGCGQLVGGKGCHPEGPCQLDSWACVSHRTFNKAKNQILHLCQGDPKHKYRQGEEGIESSPEEKGSGVLVGEKLSMTCAHSPESQTCPGLHQQGCDQQVMGGASPPPLCPPETPPGVLGLALGPPTSEQCRATGVQRKATSQSWRKPSNAITKEPKQKVRQTDASLSKGMLEKHAKELVPLAQHKSSVTAGRGTTTSDM